MTSTKCSAQSVLRQAAMTTTTTHKGMQQQQQQRAVLIFISVCARVSVSLSLFIVGVTVCTVLVLCMHSNILSHCLCCTNDIIAISHAHAFDAHSVWWRAVFAIATNKFGEIFNIKLFCSLLILVVESMAMRRLQSSLFKYLHTYLWCGFHFYFSECFVSFRFSDTRNGTHHRSTAHAADAEMD